MGCRGEDSVEWGAPTPKFSFKNLGPLFLSSRAQSHPQILMSPQKFLGPKSWPPKGPERGENRTTEGADPGGAPRGPPEGKPPKAPGGPQNYPKTPRGPQDPRAGGL